MSASGVRAVAVVVPARNEEPSIRRCLDSLRVASSLVDIPVLTVVVADHCSDHTALVAEAAGATVVVTLAGEPGGGVGAARAAGCAHAIVALGPLPLDAIWLAHTDADSEVPPGWLQAQLVAAAAGCDAVVGRVRLAPHGDPQRRARWQQAYRQHSGHVHGANLGVRADAYRAVGGFAAVPAHEDLGLVRRLAAAGRPIAVVDQQPHVVTSARLLGRAPRGIAADLRAL